MSERICPDFPALFPNLPREMSPDSVGSLIATSLKGVTRHLVPEEHENRYIQAIYEWQFHPDHGAQHGLATYNGMKLILEHDETMREKCKEYGVTQSMMVCTAMLHDFAQQPGIASKDPQRNGRTDHARRIGTIAQYIGNQVFHLDQSQLKLMVDALVNHDAVLEGRTVDVEHNPLLAILSDADKLYGAGAKEGPRALMVGLLKRNLSGSKRENGWSFFRDDLTTADRMSWVYGSRWRLDGLSAVLNETYRVKFFTEYGNRVSRERNRNFLESAMIVYGRELNDMKRWLLMNPTIGRDVYKVGEKVEETLFGKNPDLATLLSLAEEVSEEEIPGKDNSKGVYRGIKLKLRAGEKELLIDPALFKFLYDENNVYDPNKAINRFMTKMIVAHDEYLEELAQQGGQK